MSGLQSPRHWSLAGLNVAGAGDQRFLRISAGFACQWELRTRASWALGSCQIPLEVFWRPAGTQTQTEPPGRWISAGLSYRFPGDRPGATQNHIIRGTGCTCVFLEASRNSEPQPSKQWILVGPACELPQTQQKLRTTA